MRVENSKYELMSDGVKTNPPLHHAEITVNETHVAKCINKYENRNHKIKNQINDEKAGVQCLLST